MYACMDECLCVCVRVCACMLVIDLISFEKKKKVKCIATKSDFLSIARMKDISKNYL